MDEPRRPASDSVRDGIGVRAGHHLRDDHPAPLAAPPPPIPTGQPPAAPRPPAPSPPPVSIAPREPANPSVGALLAGRYRLTSRLAAGSADVWRAEDELLGRPVALKIIAATDPGSDAAGRMLAEARTLAAVRHPSVAALFDVVRGTWGMGLVLELVQGETLAARLRRDGPVSVPVALGIGVQLADALDAVHRAGIVHRDLKPGNLLVGGDGVTRLIDFGIARRSGEPHSLTPDGQVEGTLRSIAPEQLSGGPVTPAVDLFGLGTVLFELVEGRPPFDTDDPAQLARMHRQPAPQMRLAPPELADLVGRLLQPVPAARPGSAAAVGTELRMIASSIAGGPLGRSLTDRFGRGRSQTEPRDQRGAGRRGSGGRGSGGRGAFRMAALGAVASVVAVGALVVGLPFPASPTDQGSGLRAEAAVARRSGDLTIPESRFSDGPSGAVTPTPRRTPKPTPRPTPRVVNGFALLDPADGARTEARAILVRGQAPARATVTRDRPLWFDEHTTADADGHWSVVVALSPGENRLTFRLADDRATERTIRVTSTAP